MKQPVAMFLLVVVLVAPYVIGANISERTGLVQVLAKQSARVYILYVDGESVNVLKQGDVRGLVSIRLPHKPEPLGNGLRARMTPVALYFTKDGKFGVASVVPGRALSFSGVVKISRIAKPGPEPEIRLSRWEEIRWKVHNFLSRSNCPEGFVELNSRYCILQNWESQSGFYASKAKTFVEWVPLMGLNVETSGPSRIDDLGVAWGAIFGSGTYASWTFSVEGITVLSRGSAFTGRRLKLTYAPEGTLRTRDGKLQRYLNVLIRYAVVIFRVPVYDKYKKRYSYIELSGTYPLEVLGTGTHVLTERDVNKNMYLTDYLVSPGLPAKFLSERKVVTTNGNGYYSNVFFQHDAGFGMSYFSTPLGGEALNWLWSMIPYTGALSITFSYASGSYTALTYDVSIAHAQPHTNYYVMLRRGKAKLGWSNEVPITTYFVTITDGRGHTPTPCFRGVCPMASTP